MIEKISSNKLLEKYKDYIEFNALFYYTKGLEYDDVYNQCYLYLLEYYLKYSSEINLKKYVNSKLRTYYNHEIRYANTNYEFNLDNYNTEENKERDIDYGTNPENINYWCFGKSWRERAKHLKTILLGWV